MTNLSYKAWLEQLVASGEDKYAYLIETKKNSTKWFFVDVLEFKNSILQLQWTAARNKATLFETEEMVEEFKAHYISPRKASIVRIKYDINFWIGG